MKSKLRKGNGILIFGVAWILVIFFLVIMFIEIFLARQNAMNTQIAADAIADGVAVYMSYEGNNYTDAVRERDYVKSLVNLYTFHDPTNTRINNASLDYTSLIEDNVVDIKVTGDYAYMTNLNTSFGEDGNAGYYTVHTGARTEFTNYGRDILQTAESCIGCLYDYGSSGEQSHEPSFFKLMNIYADNEYCRYGDAIENCSSESDTEDYYENWLEKVRYEYRAEYRTQYLQTYPDTEEEYFDEIADEYINEIKDDVEYSTDDNTRMFDCSGLVSYVYSTVSGVSGRVDTEMIGDASNNEYRVGITHVLPGDILLINGGNHVVIFVEWEGNQLRCIGANGGDENTYANDNDSVRISDSETSSVPCVKYCTYNIGDIEACYHYSAPEELFL